MRAPWYHHPRFPVIKRIPGGLWCKFCRNKGVAVASREWIYLGANTVRV